jgi:SWI/SNF-related matrix-associated actin-dependent regulator of chromatin subfamily A member 5
VGSAHDPFRALTLPYNLAGRGTAAASTRGFNEEEDRFLVCMLNVLGYGAWDALKVEIRRSEQFRFNWFMKSRTGEELHRRCDALIRILEREAGEAGLVSEDVFKRKGKLPNVGRAGAGSAAGAGAGGAGSGVGAKRKRPSTAGKGAAAAAAAALAADEPSVAGSEDAEGSKAAAAKKARAGGS